MANVCTFILVALLLLPACGEGADPGSGLGTLVGSSWTGNFNPTAETLVGQTAKVKMDFHNDQSFLIAPLEAALTGLVKGTYREMPRNSVMMFDLQESTFDLLGKSGTHQNYSYELKGNELVLDGSNGKYFLVKDGDTNGGGGTKSSLEGEWNCRPSDRSSWFINISGQTFRGNRSEPGSRTLFFEGSVDHLNKEQGKAAGRLIIKSSNYDPLVGTTLQMHQTSEKEAVIRQINAEGNTVGGVIKCTY